MKHAVSPLEDCALTTTRIIATDNIAQIIDGLIDSLGYADPTEINDEGMFWVFADKLAQAIRGITDDASEQTYRLESDQIDSRLPAHEWVVHQNRHYDAETPAGVVDPRDLPYFRRAGLPSWFALTDLSPV